MLALHSVLNCYKFSEKFPIIFSVIPEVPSGFQISLLRLRPFFDKFLRHIWKGLHCKIRHNSRNLSKASMSIGHDRFWKITLHIWKSFLSDFRFRRNSWKVTDLKVAEIKETSFGVCITYKHCRKTSLYIIPGALAGGRGKLPPPETEKNVVEKWSSFAGLDKMTKILEDRRENG